MTIALDRITKGPFAMRSPSLPPSPYLLPFPHQNDPDDSSLFLITSHPSNIFYKKGKILKLSLNTDHR